MVLRFEGNADESIRIELRQGLADLPGTKPEHGRGESVGVDDLPVDVRQEHGDRHGVQGDADSGILGGLHLVRFGAPAILLDAIDQALLHLGDTGEEAGRVPAAQHHVARIISQGHFVRDRGDVRRLAAQLALELPDRHEGHDAAEGGGRQRQQQQYRSRALIGGIHGVGAGPDLRPLEFDELVELVEVAQLRRHRFVEQHPLGGRDDAGLDQPQIPELERLVHRPGVHRRLQRGLLRGRIGALGQGFHEFLGGLVSVLDGRDFRLDLLRIVEDEHVAGVTRRLLQLQHPGGRRLHLGQIPRRDRVHRRLEIRELRDAEGDGAAKRRDRDAKREQQTRANG
jgi:hypothetical protein